MEPSSLKKDDAFSILVGSKELEGGLYSFLLKFPRISVWDPYKRLGMSRGASEKEIWSSGNFLSNQYSGHQRSAESIEAAFERLLMTSFKNWKRTKVNLKTRLKKKVEESPPWVKQLISFVEIPPGVIILRRLFLFGFMACWSVLNSAEAGPAFQDTIQRRHDGWACWWVLVTADP